MMTGLIVATVVFTMGLGILMSVNEKETKENL